MAKKRPIHSRLRSLTVKKRKATRCHAVAAHRKMRADGTSRAVAYHTRGKCNAFQRRVLMSAASRRMHGGSWKGFKRFVSGAASGVSKLASVAQKYAPAAVNAANTVQSVLNR